MGPVALPGMGSLSYVAGLVGIDPAQPYERQRRDLVS